MRAYIIPILILKYFYFFLVGIFGLSFTKKKKNHLVCRYGEKTTVCYFVDTAEICTKIVF